MIRVILDQKDLGRLGKAFQRLKGAFVNLDGLVEDIAEEYAEEVRRNITSQNLPNYPTRTKKWMDRKAREGAPPDHWIYKYRALNGIGLRPGSKPHSYEVWSWDVPHAKYMEKGGGKPTPVPVFKWTLDTYEPRALSRIKKWFAGVETLYS